MSLLEEIKKINNFIDIFTPSVKGNIKFKPLNLKQQREILDNLELSATAIIKFFNNTKNIIQESILEDPDTPELNVILTVIDRPNILIGLRNNIDSNYNGFNLQKLLEKNATLENIPVTNKKFITKDLIIECSIPDLNTDYRVNKFLIENTKDDKAHIGKLYVNEVVKFIKSISFKENEENKTYFDKIDTKEAFDIVENIQSLNLKDVYEYIKEVRAFERELVTLNKKQVDIGPELFVL
tara:strand:+ start:339 stop:1055 length:717 start_codon:yes stop_codon:yes gene_type:complete